jgi:MFS family permease
MRLARLGSLLRTLQERNFRLLWVGQTTSALGDSFIPVALAFAVIDLTGSRSDLGFVLMAGVIPRVGLVLVGGVWADRLRRQVVMLSADATRCITQALVAAVLLSGSARIWHLIVLSAAYGAATAFFSPAETGLIPATVAPEGLQQANALMGLSRSAAWVIGPAVSGGLVALSSPGWAFAVDAGSFAVSAASLALLAVPAMETVARTRFFEELREGWHELRRRTWVWSSVLYFGLWNLAVAPVWVLGPFVAARSLGGASAWGVIATCAAIGSVLGGTLALRLAPSRPLLVGYVALTAMALEPAALARPFPVYVVAATALVGVSTLSLANTLWQTTLQAHVPVARLSRVSAYDWLGSLVFTPIGYAVAGPLSNAIGVRATLLGSAAILGSSGFVVGLLPDVRSLRRTQSLDV